MAQQTINVGAAPNDGTGTPLRTAFQYTNSNFSELYTAVGPSGNNIVVPGTATITGDLTVRTNKLFVNATGVGVGTTSVFGDFTIQNGSNCRFEVTSSAGGTSIENLNNARNAYLNMTMYADAYIWNRLGTTAMTLNSTGLGVGVSPSYKVHVFSASPVFAIQDSSSAAGGVGGTINFLAYTSGTSGANIEAQIKGVKSSASSAGELQFFTSDSSGNSQQRFMVDGSGNVGIGVTPSAWAATFKPVQIGSGTVSSAFIGQTNSPVARIITNAYFDGTNFVKVQNNTAGMYVLSNNQHEWHNAVTGTGTATFTQAMTLDASGNLLVGTVTSPTGTKIGSIAKLGGVSVEGTSYISVSTTPVALARAIGTGALFFVAGFNTTGGAQGWWLVASTGGAAPTVIASGNSTGLTVAFTTVAGVLNMNTTSGTLSVTAFAITN